MATVVNNTEGTRSSGLNSLIGIILVLVIAALVIFYGLPMLRGGVGTGGGTNVTVPGTVNVNPK